MEKIGCTSEIDHSLMPCVIVGVLACVFNSFDQNGTRSFAIFHSFIIEEFEFQNGVFHESIFTVEGNILLSVCCEDVEHFDL